MILSKNKINQLDLDDLLNDFINEERLNELIIIVPTNRKIRYLKRDLISLSPNKSVSKLNLHTFETFTRSIFANSDFNNDKMISEASAAVLLNKSFKETKLNYFSNYKDEVPRGTLDRIKNVISEYKLNGISPEQIISESKKLEGSEKFKAIDIANVYQIYLTACRNLKLFEVGDVYTEVLKLNTDEFEKRFKLSFNEVVTIVINGFDEFTQPEIDIINATANIPNVNLFVLFDYYRFNPSLFEHLNLCYEKFIAKNFSEIKDISKIDFRDYQSRVREKLFQLDVKDKPKTVEVELTELIAQTSEDEVRIIAKEIKNLILEKNIDSSSVAVVFNLISDHSNIIQDVFSQYGIPYNLTDRFSLSESQPIIALINFLEILENNFYYKNIFRALTGNWINVIGIDLSNLLKVSSNLKIISGYTNWIEVIERTLEEIELLEYDEDNEDNGFLSKWHYEHAKSNIEKIFEILKPFKTKKNISEFRKLLFDLLHFLKLPERVINDQPEFIEKNVKALTVFIEALEELFDLLQLEYGKEKEFSLSFYLIQIKTAVQFTRYNVKERHANGVLITSVNELRGLKFDYVFIGGLVDGEFPTRYQPEIFFSASFKKDEHKHILEDRYHFYQTLNCVNKGLYLSHSMQDDKKEFTPSTFIEDFKRLFILNSKSSDYFNNFIYSKSEANKALVELDDENLAHLIKQLGIDTNILKRNLDIDKIRLENPLAESIYLGYLSGSLSDESKNKLTEQKFRQYSASQLEEYAKCPFQYFAKRILQLEIIKEPTDDLEALELGSIIHSILYEFYKTIKQEGIILSNCDDKIFNDAVKIIFNIAEKKFEKLHLKSNSVFYEKEKILGIAGENRNSILYKFLEEERNNLEGYQPEYFELQFGKFNEANDDDSKEIEVGGVKVRGKIDRMDIDKSKNRFNVIDYKLSGKKPNQKDLLNGLSLQLPLYIYASKILIEAELNTEFDPAEAIIYSLKLNKGEFGKKIINLYSSRKKNVEDELIKSNTELIDICNEFIPRYVDKISNGIFNLSELEDRENRVCRFCDFKSICRIQEII
jgi:ATP-dependent helicase/nuclease subunit B